MSTDGIGKFLEMAEECRRKAEQAISPLGRETWLRAATEWQNLAEYAEQRVEQHN